MYIRVFLSVTQTHIYMYTCTFAKTRHIYTYRFFNTARVWRSAADWPHHINVHSPEYGSQSQSVWKSCSEDVCLDPILSVWDCLGASPSVIKHIRPYIHVQRTAGTCDILSESATHCASHRCSADCWNKTSVCWCV